MAFFVIDPSEFRMLCEKRVSRERKAYSSPNLDFDLHSFSSSLLDVIIVTNTNLIVNCSIRHSSQREVEMIEIDYTNHSIGRPFLWWEIARNKQITIYFVGKRFLFSYSRHSYSTVCWVVNSICIYIDIRMHLFAYLSIIHVFSEHVLTSPWTMISCRNGVTTADSFHFVFFCFRFNFRSIQLFVFYHEVIHWLSSHVFLHSHTKTYCTFDMPEATQWNIIKMQCTEVRFDICTSVDSIRYGSIKSSTDKKLC